MLINLPYDLVLSFEDWSAPQPIVATRSSMTGN